MRKEIGISHPFTDHIEPTMTKSSDIDIVFLNPGEPAQIYQGLSDEFSAIEPPAFAGLFATYARNKGAGVAIVDAPGEGLSADAAAKKIVEDMRPTLVAMVVYGFQPSASTQNMSAARKAANAIKAIAPDLPIVMTGTHPAALPERTLREEPVDFVCDLEGPITILKTWEAIKAGEGDFSKVPSLWWRDEDGAIRKPGRPEGLVDDLDGDMPGIAWDLLPMQNYRSHNWHAFDHIHDRSPYAAIHTTLGCPYKCNFCCINAPFGKPSYRMWSPDSVVNEVQHLVENYGVKNIKIVDEMFVLNRRHVMGVTEKIIERGLDVNFWAYARVDTVQDDFLENLKRAGINWLALGIESASAEVRDGASKKFKASDIEREVRKIQGAGIHVLGNYIFGLPDDNYERMEETMQMALELNTEFANFYSAMAYPGSQLYNLAMQHEWPLPTEWHHFSQHGYECLPLPTNHLDAASILEFRDKAWDRYFSSPTYLDLVKTKFGPDVLGHVQRMTKMTLKRKLVEEKYAA